MSKSGVMGSHIICLPSCYQEVSKSGKDIAIRRKKRAILVSNGLIGKVHLESDWTEDKVFTEIGSHRKNNGVILTLKVCSIDAFQMTVLSSL